MKQDAAPPIPAAATDASGRLLVVDDNVDYLRTLEMLLEGTGHECHFCSDGPAAIDVARREEIDLLLTDVRMTPLDGVETAREVKRLQPLAAVIMMTGFDKEDTPLEALRLGAADYIDKPITDARAFLRLLGQHVLLAQNAKQLQRTKERLETVIQNVDAGVIVLDESGCIEEINAAAEDWVDGDQASVRGRPLAEVVRIVELAAQVPAAGAATFDLPLVEGGVSRLLQVAVTRLAGPGEQAAGAVLLIKDLTALAEAQKAEGWRQMSRAITHGMKTPLATLRMRLEGLADAPPSPNWSQERERMLRLVSELHGRLGDLVSFVRLDVSQSDNDVGEVVRRAVAAFEKHRAPRASIELLAAPDPLVALCSPPALTLALENLLANSQESTNEAVRIEVDVARHPQRAAATITISDDGPGIPAELRDEVFRRPLNSTKPGGTGLGTALVKYIVDQHRGALHWQSPVRDDGRGTRVTIELPLAE